MFNETKLIFDNIRNMRDCQGLLTEGVSDADITKAIQNHEYVYIYYEGDGSNQKGYRTIRPYVLGTSKAGNPVVRAWQDNPKNSVTFDNRPTRKDSQYHDYWIDETGVKPGWRMFRLDKISSIYPTGKKFNDENGLVMIPAGYHEGGDDDMTSIKAYVSTKTQPDFEYKYEKEFLGGKKTKADIAKQKWDSIRRGSTTKRKITGDDVIKLRDIASRIYKKSLGSFLVVIDDKNNFQLITPKDRDKYGIPDNAIVGNLPYLYDTLVKANVPTDNKFFNAQKNLLKSEANKNSSMDISNRKPFFKQ
jgi:hypothetical protein